MPEGTTPPLPGTQIKLRGTFRTPERPRNPHEWDEAADYAKRGLLGSVVLHHNTPLEILKTPPWWHLSAWGERGKRALSGLLSVWLSTPNQRAVVLGIALGLVDGLEDAPLQAFRRTGSWHLFSVSGMHVGMLVAILWLVLQPLAAPRNKMVWIILPVVLAYALVTGWEAPAVRAAIMTGIVLAGLALDRTPRIVNSLAAAFLLLLLLDPGQRHDLGFQMTFSVVLAILLLGLPLTRVLSAFGQPDPFIPADLVTARQRNWARGTRIIMGSLAFGIAANIGALPHSLHHFNLITPSGIFLGLPLVPIAWLILAGALAALLPAALGLGWLAAGIGSILGRLADLCIALCSWVAALPGAWIAPYHAPETAVEVVVFDLDKGGSAMLARTANSAWLVETGNPGHAKRIVGRACTQLGVVPPDMLLLTHKDAQHRGGYAEFLMAVNPPHSTLTDPAAQHLLFDADNSCKILFPPTEWRAARADDRASVLHWQWAGWRLLWLGDAGYTAQQWMLENVPTKDLRCDVLCVGWHATDIGLLKDFVAVASPRLIVWHRWRHGTLNPPEDSMRTFLRARNIVLWEQARTGAVTLKLNAEKLVATPFLYPENRIELSPQCASTAGPESFSPEKASGSQNP